MIAKQLFRDYVRAYHIVDPWLISSYLAGPDEVATYSLLTQVRCEECIAIT